MKLYFSCYLSTVLWFGRLQSRHIETDSESATADLRSEEFTCNWLSVAAMRLMEASVGKVDITFSPAVAKNKQMKVKSDKTNK